jgi:hypothetical protein
MQRGVKETKRKEKRKERKSCAGSETPLPAFIIEEP